MCLEKQSHFGLRMRDFSSPKRPMCTLYIRLTTSLLLPKTVWSHSQGAGIMINAAMNFENLVFIIQNIVLRILFDGSYKKKNKSVIKCVINYWERPA